MGSVSPRCSVCRNVKGNARYVAREMMFGFRDAFTYAQCARCEALFLVEGPSDLTKYYPKDYYSLSVRPDAAFKHPVKRLAKRLQTNYIVTGRGKLGKLAAERLPVAQTHAASLAGLGLTHRSRVLDVGCGAGFLLYALRNAGFTQTAGCDPYLDKTITYPNGLTLYKRSIHEMAGTWDVVMFHHAFEHLPDPRETLQTVARLLAPGGVCLIRIPISASYAWDHYRTCWAQLDAPRHFFLHSPTSLGMLAEDAGLRVERVVYDSTAFQFWASERYLRDIPLLAPVEAEHPAEARLHGAGVFTQGELDRFAEQAAVLNAWQWGDQAAFYLRK